MFKSKQLIVMSRLQVCLVWIKTLLDLLRDQDIPILTYTRFGQPT